MQLFLRIALGQSKMVNFICFNILTRCQDGFFLEVGLHVRNLLDEKYYDNIRTNAFGNRFYEPASLRSFILSIKTTF